jgi:hypothetical protein
MFGNRLRNVYLKWAARKIVEDRIQDADRNVWFGPARKEATGGWRTLHSEALHDFHPSPVVVVVGTD